MRYRYGKNVLITGGTSGIGKATAMLLAENGYNVFAVSRSAEKKSERHGNGTVTYFPMDVCDDNSIAEVAAKIGDLGVIIHCAGFGIGGAAEDTFIADAKAMFDANYFGVLRVNRVFLPKLRARSNGVVILISSVAGRMPIPFQSHYSSTKYAIEAYGQALRMELVPHNIRVCIVEPGDSPTGFTTKRKLSIPENSPYKEACIASVEKMANDERNGYPPEKVAAVVLKNIERTNPPVTVAVGVQYKLLVWLKRLVPTRFLCFVLRKLYCCESRK